MNAILKYWQTILMTGLGPLEDAGWALLGNYGLRLLRVLLLLSLWRTLLPPEGTISGMTLSAVLTYTLISEVFAVSWTSAPPCTTPSGKGISPTGFCAP